MLPSRLQRLFLLISAAALGASHFQFQESSYQRDEFANRLPEIGWQPMMVEGTVRDIARLKPSDEIPSWENEDSAQEWNTILPFEITAVRDGMNWRSIDARVTLVVQEEVTTYLPGDRIRVAAFASRITGPSNPGQSDMRIVYARRGEFARLKAESASAIDPVGIDWRFLPYRCLGWIVQHGNEALHRRIGDRQGPLASALILGQREQVTPELRDALQATGTIHLLSISGLHVEMVAASVIWLAVFFRIRRTSMLLLVSLLTLFYAMLTGSSPPVIRATVLVVGLSTARYLGRASTTLNLLLFGAIVLLAYQPSLLFDLGTQLSFLAVATLILAYDRNRLENTESDSIPTTRPWLTGKLLSIGAWLRVNFVTSFGVWLLSAPLVLYHFHLLSLVSIILNVLLIFPVLFALLAGLAVVLFDPWLPPLSWLMGMIAAFCLELVELIVRVGEQVPLGHAWLPAPSITWLAAVYASLGLTLLLGWWRPQYRWRIAAIMCAWLMIGVTPGLVGPSGHRPIALASTFYSSDEGTHDTEIYFVDVGHGTCVIVRDRENRLSVYDAGRLGDRSYVHNLISGVLWSTGSAKLESLILSHADSDHYSGIPGLLERFTVKQFVTTQRMLEDKRFQVNDELESPSVPFGSLLLDDPRQRRNTLREIRRLLDFDQIPIISWQPDELHRLGSVDCRVLLAANGSDELTDNATSLCLEISQDGWKVLLLGDLESPGTELLLAQPSPSADVVMAPHHGSLSEPVGPVLKWSNAQRVVISGGLKAARDEVLEAYTIGKAPPLVTALEGCLKLRILDRSNLMIERWKDDHWELLDQLRRK